MKQPEWSPCIYQRLLANGLAIRRNLAADEEWGGEDAGELNAAVVQPPEEELLGEHEGVLALRLLQLYDVGEDDVEQLIVAAEHGVVDKRRAEKTLRNSDA